MPLSLAIMPGRPRRAIGAVGSRAARRPEIDVSGIAARHSPVTSLTTLRVRRPRPLASWSCTKTRDERALTFASIRIVLAAGAALAHRQPLLAVQPVDTVHGRGLPSRRSSTNSRR